MIVCLECGHTTHEDGWTDPTVCEACGASLAPVTTYKGRRRETPALSEGSFKPVKRSGLPEWIMGIFAIWSVVALIMWASKGSDDVASTRLDRAATDIARLVDSGDTSNVMQVVETARIESGCGFVSPFVFPAPQQQSSGGMMGAVGPPPDPEALVVGQVEKEYRPDAIESALAAGGRQVVVVAGWSC